MTDDQIRDLVMVLVFLAMVIGLMVIIWVSLYRHYKRQGLDRFDHYLDSLKSARAEYQFFTTGHPEVWCETTEEEIRRWIVNQCIMLMGGPVPVPSPSRYALNVDEGRQAVYIVFTDKRNFTFDWNSLVHYEDWIGDKSSSD